jgi:hypothetical protein
VTIWILLTGLFAGTTVILGVAWFTQLQVSSTHMATIDELLDRIQAPDLVSYKVHHPDTEESPYVPPSRVYSDPTGLVRHYEYPDNQ